MHEDFDSWNLLKKKISNQKNNKYIHQREVWWVALGLNVGAELNGKHENFERPVLVLRAYNRETLLVLPLTTQVKDGRFYFPVTVRFYRPLENNYGERNVSAGLTQSRVISGNRLLRKAGFISESDFKAVRLAYINSI